LATSLRRKIERHWIEKLKINGTYAWLRLTGSVRRVGMARLIPPVHSRSLMIQLCCRFPAFALALALSAGFAAAPARAEEPIGMWLTQQGDAQIRLAKCGRAMCGTVAWLRDAIDPKTGHPPMDDKNPDASKRTRKILGMRIFAMEPDGNGAYTGDIYNADDGKTYKGRLVPRGNEDLEVQGCNASNLCGFEMWSRVNEGSNASASDQNRK
jgi:uncharacterized protein (DUF2147 family)